MTLDESILGMRLRVMLRAHELGNVRAACAEAGISRTLFDRWRERFERYGPDGLHPVAATPGPGGPHELPRTWSGWCSGSPWPGPRGAVGD